MAAALDNENPLVRERETVVRRKDEGANRGALLGNYLGDGAYAATLQEEEGSDEREPIDSIEVFEHIRDIADPEHPYSLEQLGIVSHEDIKVDDVKGVIDVYFTPTVAHCSMATLIGLCIRAKIMRVLPSRFKVKVVLSKGSHSTEEAVNKQLNDKERVLAALENPNLLQLVNKCLAPTEAA
ncbi:iron-sulfur cluster assembly protein [Chloropicon primus]|uniref:MIP18 family-like domain-containing protein n=1 Tax=Chloropicon primus TaxID=1764295 RepID=A0A5B8MEG6_9CHLO|nr:hypothetical protein A3770_02p10720 [Chloropicon primus]UPQ97763.1 iron-sulfur cluster assembly protein [Chloropicon primus]|eukprot:QDZ18554.1 hypothetical protein A3770_02p10720 [Chloropicon primus]